MSLERATQRWVKAGLIDSFAASRIVPFENQRDLEHRTAMLTRRVGRKVDTGQEVSSSPWIGAGNRIVKRVSPNSRSNARAVTST